MSMGERLAWAAVGLRGLWVRLRRGMKTGGPGGPTFEELMTALHWDEYRDVVKYVVCHPMANGLLGVKAEHPATDGLTGRGHTWREAATDLLRQVQNEARR
jgi:hypothetical protein